MPEPQPPEAPRAPGEAIPGEADMAGKRLDGALRRGEDGDPLFVKEKPLGPLDVGAAEVRHEIGPAGLQGPRRAGDRIPEDRQDDVVVIPRGRDDMAEASRRRRPR